ncbi:hypothetical protein I314_04983 [Cryptococcus bacillisporus CA1873]|uniref:DUF985 domain-containing protein n=1 Tax=Cryptococcus bacillisporus CA1873 TaxID=1296111 RepID=A0ABR5B6N1_CRYGA|nr:hypothetical protein I314_04983 [Cryptococcus bacillisporus CA1873]|eukprot:KIR58999.1 hypothetical protein I314_04983 [Cryptococcus gattii CA1873]
MPTTPRPNYPYPVPNSELIATHSLQKHFEGGFFVQSVAVESTAPKLPATQNAHVPKSDALRGRVQHPFGPGTELLCGPLGNELVGEDKRLEATLIYYLLTPESYRGKMHMNLHSTFHLHHAGRALYTLIRPPQKDGDEPTVRRVMMGSNSSLGEVTQLFVPGGWWKASEIPEEDMLLLEAVKDNDLKERIGCLISEVVVPGWNPDQHQFIDEDKLRAMWGTKSGWEQYTEYIHPPQDVEYPDK